MTPSRYWAENDMVIWAIAGGQYLTIVSQGHTYDEVMAAIENHLGSIPKPLIFLNDTCDVEMGEDFINRGLHDIEV